MTCVARGLAGAALVLVCVVSAAPVLAQELTVQSIQPISLGTIASGTGTTVFQISANSGLVTRISGSGQRLGSAGARALVTIACGTDDGCDSRTVRITLAGLGAGGGRLEGVGNFTISPVTAIVADDLSGSDPAAFTIAPIGANTTATFYVGGDVSVSGNDSGGSTGLSTAAFQVVAAFSDSGSADVAAASVNANVLRPVTLTVESELAFGTIVRPREGSATVSIDPNSGARSVVGANAPLMGATTGRARFTAVGEGGQTIALSIPPSFDLVNGTSSIEVALTSTVGPTATLSGAIGSEGTAAFGVGGEFAIDSSTATGAYSGTFPITVSYN